MTFFVFAVFLPSFWGNVGGGGGGGGGGEGVVAEGVLEAVVAGGGEG